MEKKARGVLFLAAFLCGFCMISMRAQAHDVKDEDYLLRTQKPEGVEKGHYMEFVNSDKISEIYTVQPGDTLWGIARRHCGSGTEYRTILEDNKEWVDTPERLQAGTQLQLRERLYSAAGVQDCWTVNSEVMHREWNTNPAAWNWNPEEYPYQSFQATTYCDSFGENDPYRHWEEFKREVIDCGRRICGGRVTDFFFDRYRVTDICDLCYYQFVFDGGDKQYLIMVSFAYTDGSEEEEGGAWDSGGAAVSHDWADRRMETFTVCDLGRCDGDDLERARSQTLYAPARCMVGDVYLAKNADYVGADDWNYPQLRNPFTQAMRSLCSDPMARAEASFNDREIVWKDAVLEKLVREELVRLWQLTDEERQAFMARPVTSADLSRITCLNLYAAGDERVCLWLNGYSEYGEGAFIFEGGSWSDSAGLISLDDLGNFTGLKKLNLDLENTEIADFAALGALTGLRELDLEVDSAKVGLKNEDIAFLGKMTSLRRLRMGGWHHGSLDMITDLGVLQSCPHLAYLMLETGSMENWDFLAEMPEMYYLSFLVRYTKEDSLPAPEDLPDIKFIFYNGETMRYGAKELE